MGTIVISENITIDGVIQDPTGDDGFAHGGWFNEIGDDDRQGWAEVETGEAQRAEALLLGRRTYDYLARTLAAADRRLGRPVEQHAQVRRVLDPPRPGLDQLDGPDR